MSYRTHGGKGDKRRESLVDESVIVEEWDRIFAAGGKVPGLHINTNVYVLRRNKMKMKIKDKVVLQTLRTAIHVLDTAAKVFAGASDDLINHKREVLAKNEEGQDES